MKNFENFNVPAKKAELKTEVQKQEQLFKAGFYPLRTSLVDLNNIDNLTKNKIKKIKAEGTNVDYYASQNYYKKNNMGNNGTETYVISNYDETDKFSEKYYNCTGIIIIGEDQDSKKQLSMLSHQDPTQFLSNSQTEFSEELLDLLQAIKKESKTNSLDATIIGGDYDLKEYKKSIKLIGNLIYDALGFEPTVITGPNLEDDHTSVYLNTQQRRLYLIRKNQQKSLTANENFLPSEYEEKSRFWQYFRKK